MKKIMKQTKYTVIGSPAQWAITDFGLSLVAARRSLKPAQFINGRNALEWMWGFSSRRDAEYFAARQRVALAFHAGRLGRWIIPTFVVAKR